MNCGRRSPRSRRGFIILFGSKNVVSGDPPPRGAAQAKCPRCGRVGTLAGKRVRRWFTLFLMPVFPVGAERTFTQCKHCGASFAGSVRRIAGVGTQTDARQAQRGIALYNSLRSSPGNSVTLNELMALYVSMGEPEQAVGAAADFPDALNASEQCMVTLGRAYLAAGQSDEAIRWWDQALARNPDLGEAHYQRARAYMAATPPDVPRALAAARAARRADHPGAADLLAAAEALERGDGA